MGSIPVRVTTKKQDTFTVSCFFVARLWRGKYRALHTFSETHIDFSGDMYYNDFSRK